MEKLITIINSIRELSKVDEITLTELPNETKLYICDEIKKLPQFKYTKRIIIVNSPVIRIKDTQSGKLETKTTQTIKLRSENECHNILNNATCIIEYNDSPKGVLTMQHEPIFMFGEDVYLYSIKTELDYYVSGEYKICIK